MAMDDLSARLNRFCAAFAVHSVPFALVGGQAVILWVSTRDPSAVRTTKDIDILLDRRNLPAARARRLRRRHEDYFEVVGVGMFLERDNPNPRHGVHLIWAGEEGAAGKRALPRPPVRRSG